MKRIALLFASFVILISTLVYADQEKIQRGISWLGGQQTAEGAFYSAGGFADALQVTSESVSVLDKSQDAVFDKAAASAFVDQDRQSHTEALYWKIRIKSLSQQSVTSEFTALKANQNFDGGFGSYQGYDSNALDSAFALKAALIAEPSNSALISNVLGYLLQSQRPSGAFVLNLSNQQSVYVTSLVLSALNSLKFHFQISSEIEKATDFLVAELNAAQSNSLTAWQKAIAIIAIRQATVDATDYQSVSDALLNEQLANGSWQDDAYTTALILKSSEAVSSVTPPAVVTEASVSGRVLNRDSGAPIAGANVQLYAYETSSVAATLATNGQGLFQIQAVPAGNYQIEIAAPGYLPVSADLTLVVARNLELGNVSLEAVSTQAVLQGTVVSAEDGLVLPNVQVSAAGATAVTDQSGFYRLTLAPGDISIQVSLAGYQTVTATASLVAGTVSTFSPSMYLEGSQTPQQTNLTGRVLDLDSLQPIADVVVRLNGTEVATTNANGLFEAQNVAAGAAVIELSKSGYAVATLTATLQENATNQLGDLTLQQQATNPLTTVMGLIRDAQDESPIDGAEVRIPELALSAMTDDEGRYRIEGIAETQFSIEINAVGYFGASSQVDVALGTTIVANADLHRAAATGIEINEMRAATGEVYEAYAEVELDVGFLNTGDSARDVRLFLKVVNSQGQVVEQYPVVSIPMGGTLSDALMTLEPGVQTEAEVEWHITDHAADHYNLIVQAYSAEGQLLVERGELIQVLPTRRIGGHAGFSPPITQLAGNRPVAIEATIANRGNTNLPPQQLTATVALKTKGFGPERVDTSIEDYVSSTEMRNQRSSALDSAGNYYYLNDSGRELKKRHPDGSYTVVLSSLPTSNDVLVDEQDQVHVLASNSITIVDANGDAEVTALDFSGASHFARIEAGKYFVWHSGGLRRVEFGQPSTVIVQSGLSSAQAAAQLQNGDVYIADANKIVYLYRAGVLTEYNTYSTYFPRLIAFGGERLIGVDSSRRNIYELNADGSLQLIAADFGSIQDIKERDGGLIVTDSNNHQIVQVALDGSKTVLLDRTFTGTNFMVELGGELFGIRDNNRLVKFNEDLTVDEIATLSFSGIRSFENDQAGGFIAATYNRLYRISVTGDATELVHDGSPVNSVRVDPQGEIYADTNGSLPIRKIAGTVQVERMFAAPNEVSAIPGTDSLLILSGNRYVHRVNADGTYEQLQYLPFTSYNSLLSLGGSEFVAGDYSGQRLVKFNADGTNEVLVDLGFRPRFLASGSNGDIYIAEYYGNRVFRWNETDGLVLYKTLPTTVYYSFAVDDAGTLYYTGSDQFIYRSGDTDERLLRPVGVAYSMIWSNGRLLVMSRGTVAQLEADDSLTVLVNSGAIANDSSIFGRELSNGGLALVTSSSEVVMFDDQYAEQQVYKASGYSLRDYQVTADGIYLLDNAGQVLKVVGENLLPTLLQGSSSYSKLRVLNDAEFVVGNTSSLDKINHNTDVKTQLMAGINANAVLATTANAHAIVFDASTAQYGKVNVETGDISQRFYDVKSPTFIAVDANSNPFVYQNSHYIYQVVGNKLTQLVYQSSPVGFDFFDDKFVVVRGSDILAGSTVTSLSRIASRDGQSYVGFAHLNGNDYTAITRYDVVIGADGQQTYFNFGFNSLQDMDLAPNGNVLMTTSSRIVTVTPNGQLLANPFQFTSAKDLTFASDQTAYVLDSGRTLYSLDFANGTTTRIDASPLSNGSVSYNELFSIEAGFILAYTNSAAKLIVAPPTDEVNVGDVVFEATVDFPGAIKGSPALNVDFGNWTPTESGDYEVTIASTNTAVDGQLINQIHVGPLAEGQVTLAQTETLPGDVAVTGSLSIFGADSSAITTIDPDATSLAASSYTSGRAIAADSFGNIYAGDNSRIVIITPEGDVSDYVTGSLGIRNGMAIDDENNIYAGTYNGLLKVTPEKDISFNRSMGSVNAVFIDDNNIMYAATNSAVYRLDDHETPVQLASTGLSSPQAIAVDAYGAIYVLNSGNRISRISQTGAVSDYYTEANFEYEGVNLVADCSRNLLFAPTYDPVGKPRHSEEDKIVQLMADTRESRLVLDGPLYDSAMRDIDVLYYDRFGDRFLIWTDLGSGKIFSFPVICGGIDVELHVTTRADVAVAYSDVMPDQVTETNGQQQLMWAFEDVDVSGVAIPAQFSLSNMQEGENRAVLESAFLRFNNSFDPNNPIDLPLTIPTVQAVTRVSLAGYTNQSTYLPNSSVDVSVEFVNQSAGDLSGQIQYGIYDAQGNLVVGFDTVQVQDQVPQETLLIQSSWDNLDTLVGGYVLKALFNNARGELVEAIEYPFAIVSSDQPGQLGFNSHISTDKQLYEKGEVATLTTRILNTSANQVAENLLARVRILDVNDNVQFSIEQPVQTLYPNGVHNKQSNYTLSTISAGQYRAQLLVVDATTGQVVDTQYYAFTVNQGGLAGSGLVGSTQVAPAQVNKGQTFVCDHTVNNIGTADSGVIDFRSFIVRAENDELYNQADVALEIAAAGSEVLSYEYATQDLPLGGYACVLQANLQGEWQTLASAGVLVREDPILSQLSATVTAANDEVYVGEPTSCMDSITYDAATGETDVTLMQTLVSVANNMVIDTDSQAAQLIANETQVFARTYAADQLALGEYRCELYAQRNGSQRLLAQDNFTVIEPPVRVSTSLMDGQRGRLLVLSDETRQCSALEDIHVKVNWGSAFSSGTSLTIKVYNEHGVLVDQEAVTQWDVAINAGHPIDEADATVQVTAAGDVQVLLSAPVHKLGHHYRVDVKATKAWIFTETKSWTVQTDCDRPFTVGEIVEDIHLLGYKWFVNPSDDVRDLDPYGPADAPAISEQNAFLVEQLAEQGWNYTLVHNAADFTREMRQGDYAAYVMLSERAHLPVLAQKELREHVFAGKGLLVAGAHDKRNLFIEPAMGLTVTGRHPWATGLLDEQGGQIEAFPFHHLVQTASRNLIGGADIMREYSLLADDLSPEELQAGWENLHSTFPLLEDIRNYRRRAVMTNSYGLGQTTFVGYDLLAVATELGAQSESAALLFEHIERVAVMQPQAIAYKEWPVVVTITNEGSAVTGTATLTLPAGMELVDQGDFVQDGNVWQMTFALEESVNGAHSEYQKTVFVRLPAGDATQSINLYVEAQGANGGQANVEASLEITSSAATTVQDMLDLAHGVKHTYWYEPHFYVLYADLLLVQAAVDNQHWWTAQTLLVGASNMILLDSRDDVVALRLAIDEQIRLIGKQL